MPEVSHRSIADRIKETGGRSSGFDYMRVCLAVGVIVCHSTIISYGLAIDRRIWDGPQMVFPHLIVPMFFSLSGFLVAGSLERCSTLISFYGLRILRIVPALAVEVTLSALILGPLLTALPLPEYFSSHVLYVYFLNMIGYIHYHLPGVFIGNPQGSLVNAQLWTIPFELQCYLALGGLAIIGILRKKYLLLIFIIFGQCLWAWQVIRRGDVGYYGHGVSGPVLILNFLIGVLIFLFRNKIPYDRNLAIGCSVACLLLLLFVPNGSYLIPLPVTYATIYIGLLNPRRSNLISSGDYSYGLYLYGFPVQQAFASLGAWTHNWLLNLVVCVPVTFLVAFVSWNFIEKPALGFRRYLPKIEQKLLLLVRGRDILPAPSLSVSEPG